MANGAVWILFGEREGHVGRCLWAVYDCEDYAKSELAAATAELANPPANDEDREFFSDGTAYELVETHIDSAESAVGAPTRSLRSVADILAAAKEMVVEWAATGRTREELAAEFGAILGVGGGVATSPIVFQYEKDGSPLLKCPDCGHGLTGKCGVEVVVSADRGVTAFSSGLDPHGRLPDPDGVVARSDSSGTRCWKCGKYFFDWERAVAATALYTAEFDAQVWLNDCALSVDPQGDTVWDCTAAVLANPDYLTTLVAGDAGDELLDIDDVLKSDPAAPAWVREWAGPFTITVRKGAASPPPGET